MKYEELTKEDLIDYLESRDIQIKELEEELDYAYREIEEFKNII